NYSGFARYCQAETKSTDYADDEKDWFIRRTIRENTPRDEPLLTCHLDIPISKICVICGSLTGLTLPAQHQPRCQGRLFLIGAPRRIECPAKIVESKLQRSRSGSQFGSRCRFKFTIRKGTRPQLVSRGSEFQHPAKQDSFRGVRANMVIADAREVAIFRSNDANPLTAHPC